MTLQMKKRVGIKIPYYVVKHGRGFWSPHKRMMAFGFSCIPCGPDGPEAWKIACQWNDRWQKRRLIRWHPERTCDPEIPEIRSRGRPGFIYFIRSGDRIKIGFTRSPNQRYDDLQPALPRRPDLLVFIAGHFMDESDMHLRLAEHRMKGEWFAANADVLQVMMRSIAFGKPMLDFPDGRQPAPAPILARLS